jgi:Protein kinase domain.
MILEKNKEEEKMPDLKLENLIHIKNIGRGQFGEVYLVEDDKQNRYALKTVSKVKVHSLCLDRHVQVIGDEKGLIE